MGTFCLATMTVHLYLSAYNSDIVRFEIRPAYLTDQYKWTSELDIQENATRICNVQYKTCISVARGRRPNNLEILVLEKANEDNPNQFWMLNDTSHTMKLNGSKFYWDLSSDNIDKEPIQLFAWEAEFDADKFTIADCRF